MDSLYFDMFDALPDMDSEPESETSDSYCTDDDDVPCRKCRTRIDGKLCRKCYLRIHGQPDRPSKSSLELVSANHSPRLSDTGDVTGYALDFFGLSKLAVPREQLSSDSYHSEDEEHWETGLRDTGALGRWGRYDPPPPYSPPKSQPATKSQALARKPADRTCHCSWLYCCTRCRNKLDKLHKKRGCEEHDDFVGEEQGYNTDIDEEELYEATSSESSDGYTHTHTRARTKPIIGVWDRDHRPCVLFLTSEPGRRRPRHMAEIWSYTSGRRLSKWPMEFYTRPLYGTLTWPYGCGVFLGPGTLSLGEFLDLPCNVLSAWIEGKYRQSVLFARRALGFGDACNEELD
ncbi:hypothetical protein GGR52DRAFT_544428 [Hypoxylon sp. FL1284]|nr:hypothetical protein GGR52DRAFT_544428 [Hypoxylon sp. FL1284]